MKYLKINKILILILVSLLAGISCKKEIFTTDFWGTVRHYYTKEPISGIGVLLRHGHGSGWFNSTETETPVITGADGKFMFSLKKVRKDGYDVDLIAGTRDSTHGESKYLTDGITSGIDKDIHPVFYVKPAGHLYINLSDSSWSVLLADTFIIESVYTKERLIRGNSYWKEFFVESSQLNKFIWYGLKNGVKVNYEEKMIYARNFYYNVSHGYWINLGR